ncbi:methyl-accepting chemotaxis protein [Desulfovibrio psychrotolerans]|uniref:Methyl-accepting transducer domain-containing protein n=1 Tax=Desulfovibrio psychrotolerans TaxID=415242 RepID=A0A7J0BPT1_9BACT|nr:methyl-accepting chemotaxis protein [Desulfovibrio psychrotolerans]GFM35659.1 hypothetical protein DSM19430T_03430 [Desulfovibrio psychrotolerans]
MRIGSRIFWGFGLMFALLAVLAVMGWEGHRRLTEAQSVLERRASLESDIRSMQTGAQAVMLDPKPGALDAVLSRSGMLDQALSQFKLYVEHDMLVRLDRAMRANIEFRGAMEKWQAVADARAARAQEAESAAAEYARLLEEMGGGRSAMPSMADAFSISEPAGGLEELRLLNVALREYYESRLLLRQWQDSGDVRTLEEVRSRMGASMTAVSGLRSRMPSITDRDRADTLLAHGRDYLAALGGLEDSAAAMNEVRATLASAVADMRAPLNMLSDRYLAAIDYVRDIGMLAVGGTLALAFVVSLIFGLSISGAVRRRNMAVASALQAIAEGKPPVDKDGRAGTGRLPEEMAALMDAVYKAVRAGGGLTEQVQAVAQGKLDVRLAVRAEDDVLGAALSQLVEGERVVRDVLAGRSQGDYRLPVVVRSRGDELMAALAAQGQFVCARIAAARTSASLLKEHAGRAMESLKALEGSLVSDVAQRSTAVQQQVSEMYPRMEAVFAAVKDVDRVVRSVAQEAQRMRELSGRVDGGLRALTGKASFLEDVARQVEALAINVNIEMARAGDDGRGLQAIGTEMRSVVERCREHAADMHELMYSGRRASDDLEDAARNLLEDLEVAARGVAEGLGVLGPEVARLRDMPRQARAVVSGGAADAAPDREAQVRRLTAGLGKAFSGLVMELNSLRAVLDSFKTPEDPGSEREQGRGGVAAEAGRSAARAGSVVPAGKTLPPLQVGAGGMPELWGADNGQPVPAGEAAVQPGRKGKELPAMPELHMEPSGKKGRQ